MGVNNYQTILRIELNDQMCYSEHHLMVPEHFYCWVVGSFKSFFLLTCVDILIYWCWVFSQVARIRWFSGQNVDAITTEAIRARTGVVGYARFNIFR